MNHPSFHQTFIFLLVSAMWNKLDYFEFFPQWNLLDDARHFRQLGNFLKVPALFNPQVVPSHTLLFVSRCQKCHTENSVTRHETSKNSSNWAWSSYFYVQRSWTHFGFTIMESKMQTSVLAKSFTSVFLTYSFMNIKPSQNTLTLSVQSWNTLNFSTIWFHHQSH